MKVRMMFMPWIIGLALLVFPMPMANATESAAETVPAAAFRLPPLISEGMVLQRNAKCPIWGWAPDGAPVTVHFCGQQVTTLAKDGKFRVDLNVDQAGGPFPLEIDAGTVGKITLHKVYAGEVWLFSGQSNMHAGVAGTPQGKIAAAEPAELIHLSHVGEGRFEAGWSAADAQSIPAFSAVAFYMGKALARDLKVPIGLIQRDVSGTSIYSWIPPRLTKEKGLWGNGALYSQWIQPCQPYAIRGAVWYQGESEAAGEPDESYRAALDSLIKSWRNEWGQGDFPFIVIQLQAIVTSGLYCSAPHYVREAQQRAVADLPNAGLVVTFDVSDGNLHPANKKPMAERAALVARGLVYGEKVEYIGPVVRDFTNRGDKVIIRFDHTGKGLIAGAYDLKTDAVRMSTDTQVTNVCAVDAANQSFPVAAVIEGDTVVMDLKDHRDAAMLTYGFQQFPRGNLYNEARLPASPFRLRTRAVQVVNGGFESPELHRASGDLLLSPGKTNGTSGWILKDGSGGITATGYRWAGYNRAPEGFQQAFLLGTATLSQTLHGLTIGREYRLTLQLGRGDDTDEGVVEVLMDGKSLKRFMPVKRGSKLEQCTFTATSTDPTLFIVNHGSSKRPAFIDDVQVREAAFMF